MKNLNGDYSHRSTIEVPSRPDGLTLESPSYMGNKNLVKGRDIRQSNRNLMMNTGSNVIGSSKVNPSSLKNNIKDDYMSNISKINRKESPSSFGRLGFMDSTANDPEFNPHYEYNMRKIPRRGILNNSVEVIRSVKYKSPIVSEQKHIQHLRNQVNHTQLDHTKM